MNVKQQRASIEIDQNLQDFYTGFLDTVAPNMKRVIDQTLTDIEKTARENWLVRQPIVRTDKDGKVVFYRETTQGSHKMFERGFQIVDGGGIEGFLRNRAPYAWAIKFGEDSVNNKGQTTTYSPGKRVATELMIKPQEAATDAVVKALTDDLMKRL